MFELNEQQFDEYIYDEEQTAVILFHRRDCHTCHTLDHLFDDLETDFKDKTSFYGVDADDSFNLFERFGIQGVPQVLFFRDGNLIEKIAGRKPDYFYYDTIDTLLEKTS